MAGVEMAGLAIGIAPIVFKAVAQAWDIFDDTVTFADDTEDLVIRLETAKAHLSIWATNTGLADGELIPALHSVNDLIIRTLKRIEQLMNEVEQEGKKYGLEAKDSNESDLKKISTVVVQMRRSLHNVLASSRGKSKLGGLIEGEADPVKRVHAADGEASISRRVFWAIRDKKKFEYFINMLEKHVNGLRKLVSGTQQRAIQQEGTRFSLQIIQNVSDPNQLSQLQSISPHEEGFSEMDLGYLAQSKAIALQRAPTPEQNQAQLDDWNIGLATPLELAKVRFLQAGQTDPGVAYLLEKKEYDPNISDEDKDLLQQRIRKLVLLLGKSSSQRHLHTLQAVGHVDDPDHHCWWIVFRFPLSPLDTIKPNSSEPLSLRKLYASPLKPALEARYKLAKRLVDTFAKLYGSDWMHKSVNSSNIIFPHISSTQTSQTFRSLQTALVQGFGYSRQLTQAQTIDRGKVLNDLESAIYRHPYYQGEAASGYQIHYDIYSLGLVLLEIALWGPLMDLLAAKYRPGKEPPVTLSPDMRRFHEAEAVELKRRVMLRVEHELAYRVGTKYKDMVDWCLNLKGPVTAIEFYNTVAIPLGELCSHG